MHFSSNSTARSLPKTNRKTKGGRHTHEDVQHSIVFKKKTTGNQPSLNRGLIQLHGGIIFSHKNEGIDVSVCTWREPYGCKRQVSYRQADR